MNTISKDEPEELPKPPRTAAGGSGSGSGPGSGGGVDENCICGSGKMLRTTAGPSGQNIIAGIYNQLPLNLRTVLPFGMVPVCNLHRWK